MPSTTAGTDSGRYIIRSLEPEHLADFIDEVNEDPALRLVDTIGPTGQPHTAVFEMKPDKAASLEQRFRTSNKLKIEPDRPLSLF